MPDAVARLLGRADPLPLGEPGERAQLRRHFEWLPRGWPVAALARQSDAGDAAGAAWLRADPAWVRPDINGVRLLACGDALRLAPDDAAAFLPALRPLFGDSGFALDAPDPSRWYLRLPREARLPTFTDPADALGADLFEYLPRGDGDDGIHRRWRALLSEAQVVLHNHPWNARRAAEGKPPVNSLWFWGAGELPDKVTTRHAAVQSDDGVVRALAAAAGAEATALPGRYAIRGSDALVDLRISLDAASVARDWLLPAFAALQDHGIDRLVLDFGDGAGILVERRQRWRWWRKPRPSFAPSTGMAAEDRSGT